MITLHMKRSRTAKPKFIPTHRRTHKIPSMRYRKAAYATAVRGVWIAAKWSSGAYPILLKRCLIDLHKMQAHVNDRELHLQHRRWAFVFALVQFVEATAMQCTGRLYLVHRPLPGLLGVIDAAQPARVSAIVNAQALK